MSTGYGTTNVGATIANGQTASSEIDCGGQIPVAIIFPATFTGTSVTFKNALKSGGTPLPMVRSDGSALSATVTLSSQVGLTPSDFAGAKFLTIVSGSSEGQADALTLVLRDM